MKVVASAGRDDVAMVYVAELSGGRLVECVESLSPPIPREKKWVLLVSTMFGCPVGCQMCDAGGYYEGKPTKDEILAQIDFLVRQRYPDGRVPCEQFKIQFARMGEPALNAAVLEALAELPARYDAPGLLPSLSTVAPASAAAFFERLLEVKQAHYRGGRFQFQFSIHTTDATRRRELVPVKTWDFAEMAVYGARWFEPGDRKVTLNFALAQNSPVEAAALLDHFDPAKFLIKITPLNPTYRAQENKLATYIDPSAPPQGYAAVEDLRHAGYTVIVSIGETEENRIGSNCGQYVRRHRTAAEPLVDGYTYCLTEYA